MTIYLWGAVLGALGGLALVGLFTRLWPAPPRLEAVLTRMEVTATHRSDGSIGGWLLARLGDRGPFQIPHHDLALLGITPERFMLQRLAGFVAGALTPLLTTVVLAAGEISFPWPVPVGAALVMALVFAGFSDLAVRSQVAERRAEFRAALAVYLDLVALERSAGAAPNDALNSPAARCEGWPFLRIRQVLAQAQAAAEPPWLGLADLGRQVGINDLIELADIAETAGREGTEVLPTLLAKAQSIRIAVQTGERARANSVTNTMVVPIALTTAGFATLVAFPAIYRLIGAFG